MMMRMVFTFLIPLLLLMAHQRSKLVHPSMATVTVTVMGIPLNLQTIRTVMIMMTNTMPLINITVAPVMARKIPTILMMRIMTMASRNHKYLEEETVTEWI